MDGIHIGLQIIIGPCSIHDPEAAIQYAEQLKQVADRVRDHLLDHLSNVF